MQIVVKKLSDIWETSKNVRKHTDKQMREYIRSVKMFGQVKPIIVDETGEIIAGNGLYLALKALGEESCCCNVISGLSPAMKKKLMLADNRVYELGITSIEDLDEIIRSLEGDVDVPGYDSEMLEMMTASVPEIDSIVSDYGNFGSKDVERIQNKSAPAIERVDVQEKEPEPMEQKPVYTQPAEEPQRRIIICPKCGEQICL